MNQYILQEKNVLGIQIFESNYNIYIKYSNQLFNLLLEYTDVIERFSIDECFLDLTNFLSNNDILENKESNFHMNNVEKFVKQAKHEKRDVLEKYKECKELYGKDENIIHKFIIPIIISLISHSNKFVFYWLS